MIIANTFPKSGTGLLRQLLEPFGKYCGHIGMYDGGTGEKFTDQKIANLVYKLCQQDGVITSHLHWKPLIANMLTPGTKMIMLIRDPRDVVVSHAYYIITTPEHSLHKFYKHLSKQECFSMSMMGIPDHETEFPDIANRFLPYLGWAGMDYVLEVRYEELVEDINRECRNIASFIYPEPPPSADGFNNLIDEMASRVTPATSNTFRSGKVGEWKTEFNQRNKDQFEKHFSWFVEMIGYHD